MSKESILWAENSRPVCSCARKENVDIEILVTSRMVTGKSFNPLDE